MAYDEVLAHRIRELLGEQDRVTEMKMFGGLAFLLGGSPSGCGAESSTARSLPARG
jgi:hypothetical protein